MKSTAEYGRLVEYRERRSNWKKWGPYLSERAWGTVREDYSESTIFVEYAKADQEDILVKLTAINPGPDPARCDVLPTLWFRNTWSSGSRGIPAARRLLHPEGMAATTTGSI